MVKLKDKLDFKKTSLEVPLIRHICKNVTIQKNRKKKGWFGYTVKEKVIIKAKASK